MTTVGVKGLIVVQNQTEHKNVSEFKKDENLQTS